MNPIQELHGVVEAAAESCGLTLTSKRSSRRQDGTLRIAYEHAREFPLFAIEKELVTGVVRKALDKVEVHYHTVSWTYQKLIVVTTEWS